MKSTSIVVVTLLFIILLGNSGCMPHYIAANFDDVTADHHTVAILPVEVIFTGKVPENIAEEDILAIEEAEARAFQISFYNEILRSTRSGRKPIYIDLQHYRQTQELLAAQCADFADVWAKPPAELADILGVDAVVSARIEKMRYMSDLESYGIDLGIRLAQLFSGAGLWSWLPPGMTRAKTIRADYALLDGAEGKTLWSVAFDIDADWRRPSNEIIDDISRRAARKFPYRSR